MAQKNTRPVKAGCNAEGAKLYFRIWREGFTGSKFSFE